MKKSGRTTKKISPSNSTKGQKTPSFISKTVSGNPGKSSTNSLNDSLHDHRISDRSKEGLSKKRKVTGSLDNIYQAQTQSKVRKLLLEKESNKYRGLNVVKKNNIESGNDNDILDFLKEEGILDTESSGNVAKNGIWKKKSFSEQDEQNRALLGIDSKEIDSNVLVFLNQGDVSTKKENAQTSKSSMAMKNNQRIGRKKSLSLSKLKSKLADKDCLEQKIVPKNLEQKQEGNILRKHSTLLSFDLQNIQTSIEGGHILTQILANDSDPSSKIKTHGKEPQDQKKKMVCKVFKESKLDKQDDKLLNDLLLENEGRLKISEDAVTLKKFEGIVEKSEQKEANDQMKNESTDKVKAFIDAFSEDFAFEDESEFTSETTEERNGKANEMERCQSTSEFDDLFDDDWVEEDYYDADLNTLQRCKVISIDKDRQHNLIVHVKHTESGTTATVTFMGFWKDTKLEPGDFVNIEASKGPNGWIVDNNNGFVVSHPDTLVPGTTVVGGLFCPRRGILKERFRGIGSNAVNQQDFSMTIGTLVHELLQEVLRKKIYEMSDISKVLASLIKSRNTRDMLYSIGMSIEDCRKEMSPFVPRIFEFVERYIKGKKPKSPDDNFKGTIHAVHDIEENMWIPKLGVKGKIDATVEVNKSPVNRIMPLELKTGRSSFSIEHKGQVILYTMMMAQSGQDVDTGLLLYLRENTMREIKVGHPERRDLIHFRNSLAYYLTRRPRINEEADSMLDSQEQLELMELPEPINHRSCGNCPYNTLCCAYLSKDKKIQLPESHPLTVLSKELLSYFKPQHIDYVTKWGTLLQIEEVAQDEITALRDIWTLTPAQREKKGYNISNLKVAGNAVEEYGRFKHTFIRMDKGCQNVINDFTESKFMLREYVIVSTNTRINISSGHVVDICSDSITLLLDRDITRRNPNAVFHIDTYTSQSLLSFNLTNIGHLLENSPIPEKLRNIVIDRTPATFAPKLSRQIALDGVTILHPLNKVQQRAVLNVLRANEYLLIKGMPGTGKTQTLVCLIELLVILGKSVLVTAHTHTAVDNVLLRLNERGIDFLRLGVAAKVNPKLKHKCENVLTENCDTPESLDAAYNSKSVVGVTCLGANHHLLEKRLFDVCVVDESTQVLQPSILRPLYFASKFVLIGDPDQLPPVVKSNKARELGMDESLFVRLDNDNNTVVLSLQYRMNSRLMRIANDLTYKGQLHTGNESVANATLNIPEISVLGSCEQWVRAALSQELDDSVVMLNTGATYNLHFGDDTKRNEAQQDRRCSNLHEAAIVLRLTTLMLEAGVPAEVIGVIAPYRAQVGLLRRTIEKDIEVNTVDQYQGRDKDIIVFSCTKSFHPGGIQEREFEILEDQRRLTVAITRARHKLIMVGDRNTLEKFTPFRRFLASLRRKDILNLKEGCENFSWKTLLSLV